jgi:hypothetical protein
MWSLIPLNNGHTYYGGVINKLYEGHTMAIGRLTSLALRNKGTTHQVLTYVATSQSRLAHVLSNRRYVRFGSNACVTKLLLGGRQVDLAALCTCLDVFSTKVSRPGVRGGNVQRATPLNSKVACRGCMMRSR